MIKLTEDEKVILRNLPEHFKWIARDKEGFLDIFVAKPLKSETVWMPTEINEWTDITIFDHLFSFVKWEDEEPYLIEDLLKEELPKNFEKLSEE